MRIARKLFLLALSVCALMAFGVSSASAVEVVDEATNEHCATVITEEGGEGCPIEGEATDLELGGPFGIMLTCDLHFEFHVSEGGHLIANSYDIAPAAMGACEASSSSECTGDGDRHPEAEFTGGEGPHWDIEIDYCLNTFIGAIQCHLAGEIEEFAEHEYHLLFDHTNKCENNTGFSLGGEITLIQTENHPAIEIRD